MRPFVEFVRPEEAHRLRMASTLPTPDRPLSTTRIQRICELLPPQQKVAVAALRLRIVDRAAGLGEQTGTGIAPSRRVALVIHVAVP